MSMRWMMRAVAMLLAAGLETGAVSAQTSTPAPAQEGRADEGW